MVWGDIDYAGLKIDFKSVQCLPAYYGQKFDAWLSKKIFWMVVACLKDFGFSTN